MISKLVLDVPSIREKRAYYARPMTKGADAGTTKGLAGSRTDQITILL
jgi:hypothetical protein